MAMLSTARRLRTKKKREVITESATVDEVVEFWRTKYDAIFAAECRARRLWAATARSKQPASSGAVEAVIQARQVEWDAYVRKQLADLATAE